MPVWPRFSQSASTAAASDWWRPFFVTDTAGFAVLAEDWVVGGEGQADDVGAVLSFSAALGGAAMLAFAQRLCEHSARYAAAQAAELSSCRSGCCSCHCSCGPHCAARYFDIKQALCSTAAYALHLLVVLCAPPPSITAGGHRLTRLRGLRRCRACVSFNIWIFLATCAGCCAGELIGSSCKKRLKMRDLQQGGQYEMVAQNGVRL